MPAHNAALSLLNETGSHDCAGDVQELPADTADAVLSIAKEQREEITAEDRSQRLASGEQVRFLASCDMPRAFASILPVAWLCWPLSRQQESQAANEGGSAERLWGGTYMCQLLKMLRAYELVALRNIMTSCR